VQTQSVSRQRSAGTRRRIFLFGPHGVIRRKWTTKRRGVVSGHAALANCHRGAARASGNVPAVSSPFRPWSSHSDRVSINVSPLLLPATTHDPGPLWTGDPSTCDYVTHNTSPVYPGAHGERIWQSNSQSAIGDGAC